VLDEPTMETLRPLLLGIGIDIDIDILLGID
jgi:hypothetical protein